MNTHVSIARNPTENKTVVFSCPRDSVFVIENRVVFGMGPDNAVTGKRWLVLRRNRVSKRHYQICHPEGYRSFEDAFKAVIKHNGWPTNVPPANFRVLMDPNFMWKRSFNLIYGFGKSLDEQIQTQRTATVFNNEFFAKATLAEIERRAILQGSIKQSLFGGKVPPPYTPEQLNANKPRFVYRGNRLSPLELDILNHYRLEMIYAGASKKGDFPNPHGGGSYPPAQEAAFERFVKLDLLTQRTPGEEGPRFTGTEKLKAWHEALLVHAAAELPKSEPRITYKRIGVPPFPGTNPIITMIKPKRPGNWIIDIETTIRLDACSPGGFSEAEKQLEKLAISAVTSRLPSDAEGEVRFLRGDGREMAVITVAR